MIGYHEALARMREGARLLAVQQVALAAATGLPLATMVLGTSPGGIAEMAITAKVLQLGCPWSRRFRFAAWWRCCCWWRRSTSGSTAREPSRTEGKPPRAWPQCKPMGVCASSA